jgi:hypothetical protein
MVSCSGRGQSGATDPCSCTDKIVNVTTPATEVKNVDASAARATSDGGLPDAIRTGARIGPSPIP